ncbi:MAG TPA: maleylpyruvate isomerase N-terminal domain-containing protein [Streptosporangiaceae bacterium]|nr:maleylpyruvate isomerase N-terminal domain-containing protein [Streptosporangiaceae bacterium]
MKIRPRYGTDPLITYEGDPAAVAAPAVRQRLRLARTLAGFGSAEWEAPSRCAGWANRDVIVHLASANRFWAHSISQARRGTPSQVLADFDPVATPAGLVAAAGNPPAAEVLDAYVTSTRTLVDLLGSLTSGEWTMLGETPLGHVSVSALVRHALWDAWVHERDITLGVGLVPAVQADEVDAALRCAAALGPAFGILLGDLGDQRLAATVTTQDPAIGFTIKAGRAVRVTADIAPAVPVAVHGCAVDVLEGLSLRAPLHLEPEWQWLTAGLTHAFEARPPEPQHGDNGAAGDRNRPLE